MLIHLKQNDTWEQINSSIKKRLEITDPKVAVHTFQNIGQALFDFLLGLRQFIPHKKTVVIIEGGDPYLHLLTAPLLRESYQVITLKPHAVNANPNWFNEITAKDILCVVTSRDHAFTGELWIDDSNIKLLADKKIPLLEISHSLHFNYNFQDEVVNRPFLLQIQDYECLSIGIIGSRTKIYPQSSSLCHWNFNETMSQFDRSRKRFTPSLQTMTLQNQKAILEFEAKVLPPATPYFSAKQLNRIFDRALICLNKVTGDHFINKIKTDLNDTNEPGLVATPHLCQWGGFGSFSWWGNEGLSPEKQMTLVAISLSFINKKDSLKIFNESLSTCLKENKLV
jgi:hypothetical protein